ncbi:MAG: hypothetical protein JJE42_10380 [Burkholderiales bacterium]|nr:hypothetical protein [Burkholderiales bacterium]
MPTGLLLAMFLLLSGCANLGILERSAQELEEREVVELIQYAQRVTTMTAEQQRREYAASSQAYARDMNANSRIRLALLLATPGASVYNPARAASLLEPIAAPGGAASPRNSLARLLYVLIDERLTEQKRADKSRDQIEAHKESERGLRDQLEAQKEVERGLRDQLEALKEVERSIIQRGQDSQPRRR